MPSLLAPLAVSARDLGTSRVELECHPLPVAEHGACQIFDASRTRFLTVDAAAGDLTAAASRPGRFLVSDEPHGSWITGWYQSAPVAVRLDPVDAIRVAGPGVGHPHMLVASDRAVETILPSQTLVSAEAHALYIHVVLRFP